MTRAQLQDRVKRILAQWQSTIEATSDGAKFISGVGSDSSGQIDDGGYGDPFEDRRPEWLKAVMDENWR